MQPLLGSKLDPLQADLISVALKLLKGIESRYGDVATVRAATVLRAEGGADGFVGLVRYKARGKRRPEAGTMPIEKAEEP